MNSINANIPVINMPQVSQQHSEAQRVPAVHQTQNAQIAGDRLDIQMRAAREAEQAEGKTINPNDRREERRQPKKREQDQAGASEEDAEDGHATPATAVTMSDSGRLIDLEA